MQNYVPMQCLRPGEKAVVHTLRTQGAMRRRLLDLGLVRNTPVECIGRSPCGDPSAYLIRGAIIAIRAEDCADILLTNIRTAGGKAWV